MLWLWLGFLALVGVLLLVQRKISAPTFHGAAYWMAAWFVIGIAFVGLVYPMYEHAWLGARLDDPSDNPGADASMMFASAYLLEYALAFDTVVVISLQCRLHRVPKRHQPRVLFWGLVGAIFFRVMALTGAACLVRAFAWAFYVFGAFLIYSAIRVLRDDDNDVAPAEDLSEVGHRKHMPLTSMLWRFRRLTDHDFSGEFLAIRNGRRVLTMGAACVLSLVLIDVVFALDSAVAVVSVSKTTFIVVTSNILATIAVRSLVFVLDKVENFQFPEMATVLLLLVVGAKMLAYKHLHVPHAVLLALIAGIVGLGIAGCVFAARRRAR